MREIENLIKEVTMTFHLSVDYGRNVEDGARAGQYDWFNPEINSLHFPAERKGTVEVVMEIIQYDKEQTEPDEVIRDLNSRGMRPATIAELLAFGAAYPDMQRKFPIVALGSVWWGWHGRGGVAYLIGSASRRDLRLEFWDQRRLPGYGFAAVRRGGED